MTSCQIIYFKLCQIRNRLKFMRGLKAGITGFFIGLILFLLILVLNKFFPSLISLPFSFISFLPLIFLLFLFFWSFFQKVSLFQAASITDRKMGLKERLSTALEMIENKASGPMIKALIDDAAQNIKEVQVSQVIKFDFPGKQIIYMFLIIILISSIYFIPVPENPSIEFEELLKAEGRELEHYSERLKEKADEEKNMEIGKEMAEDFEQLGKKMKDGELSKKESLVEISSLEDKWEKEKEKLGEAGKFLDDKKDMDLTEGLSDKIDKGEKLEDILEEMAKKSGNCSDKEKKDLLADLEKLSKNLSEDNQLKEEIEKLSEALREGDKKEIAEEREKLIEKLEDLKKKQELLEETLSALEKCRKEISNCSGEKELSQSEMENLEASSFSDAFSKKPTKIPLKESDKEGSGADYGKGSTNQWQKGQSVEDSPFKNRQSEDISDKTEQFTTFYAQERVETEKGSTSVSGKIGEGETLGKKPVKGIPTKPEASYKPYRDIYQDYKDRAEEVINEQNIPSGYKDIIRLYFDDINPGNENMEGKENDG